jgi:hypothetical protein
MEPAANEQGKNLFHAARAIEETWREVDRLIRTVDRMIGDDIIQEGRELLQVKASDAEFPEDVTWAHQYNFQIFQRRRGPKSPAVSLGIEFRLSWGKDNKIIGLDDHELELSLIIVKAGNDPKYRGECFDILSSPTERAGDEPNFKYRICEQQLLWDSEGTKYVYWAFALPLFALKAETDIRANLVQPICRLVRAQPLDDPKTIGREAFSLATAVLRWKDDRGRIVLDTRL